MPELKPVVDQQTIINRNIARWQEEQKKKAEKREKLAATASARGVSVKQLISDRRQRYLLKSCRATVGEIIQQHKGEK